MVISTCRQCGKREDLAEPFPFDGTCGPCLRTAVEAKRQAQPPRPPVAVPTRQHPGEPGKRPIVMWLIGGGLVAVAGAVGLYTGDPIAGLACALVVSLLVAIGCVPYIAARELSAAKRQPVATSAQPVCPHCRRDISPTADICPHCGHKFPSAYAGGCAVGVAVSVGSLLFLVLNGASWQLIIFVVVLGTIIGLLVSAVSGTGR
jgi:hypothetical protein